MLDKITWKTNFRPLLVRAGKLYAAQNNRLYVSADWGENFSYIASYSAGFVQNQIFRLRLPARVARAGFQALQILEDGTMVAVIRKHILVKKKNDTHFQKAMSISRGSRPLNLCVSPAGRIYFGEYFDNADRQEVHIYGSDDGVHWEVAYIFPAGKIRHVHGIFFDVFRNGMWVLTGDSDEESGLWFTTDEFQHLSCFATDSQKARAVKIIPMKDCLIVPMDTPLEQNYICSFDTNTLKFNRLATLPGSAFHACGNEELALISTVVEPSKVNMTEEVAVFAGKGTKDWKCIHTIKQDKWSARSYHYFRYPELEIYTEADAPYFFLYGRGIQGLDAKMTRWLKSDLL